VKPSDRSQFPIPSPPPGLRALRIEASGTEYAIVSAPLPQLEELSAELTRTELDVVRRLLDGQSNAVIARERSTSPRTVANQVAAVYRKLRVGSRAELAALWARHTFRLERKGKSVGQP
jgi:DNA-binding CsgD family transcriptional regulator